ncbi:hypothetical protein QPK87_27605 [Kamptonema cortianum]|nr:hypothetical protein [Kamptonema cortianum]
MTGFAGCLDGPVGQPGGHHLRSGAAQDVNGGDRLDFLEAGGQDDENFCHKSFPCILRGFPCAKRAKFLKNAFFQSGKLDGGTRIGMLLRSLKFNQ